MCVISFVLLRFIDLHTAASTQRKLNFLGLFVSWGKSWFSNMLFVWCSCSSTPKWCHLSDSHCGNTAFVMCFGEAWKQSCLCFSVLSNVGFMPLRSILLIFSQFWTDRDVSFNCTFREYSYHKLDMEIKNTFKFFQQCFLNV